MKRIRKDDMVQVITGKYKGRAGRVMKVFEDENKCIVEGVGLVKKHQKATQAGGPAGIIEKNAKIDLSNVMPLDAKTKKPTRVRFETKDGTKVRLSTAGSEIDTAAKAAS